MKKIPSLLLLFMLLSVLQASAQVVWRYGADLDSGWGDAGAVITPYVLFPQTFVAPYAGNSITKVRIGVKKKATNVYLYIKNDPHENAYIYRQKLDDLEPGWTEVVLDEPFSIAGDNAIALGYKGNFAESGGVGYSSEKFTDGDMVYYNSKNSWTTTGGSVCIQAIVEGDRLPQNELMIGKMSGQRAPYDAETVDFSTTVRNVGGNKVSSYTVAYSLDGTKLGETTVDKELEVNATDSVRVSIPSVEVGEHQVTVSIVKVNGVDDAYAANNTVTATLVVRDREFIRRVLCEEFTYQTCSWCPRGFVGLEMMKEQHGDNFIPICVHATDKFEIDATATYNYSKFIASVPGAPFCSVNRKLSGDPLYNIQSMYNIESAADNHLAYYMTAEWNEEQTAITVESTFYSDVDIAAPNYYIAYTITEDSITGYPQANGYSGSVEGAMGGWEKKSNPTTDVYFMDTARGIFPCYDGEPCVTSAMKARERLTHSYTIPLPSNVADKRQVNVVGQIIDHNTGYVLNAFTTRPARHGETGISQARTDVQLTFSRDDGQVHLRSAASPSGNLTIRLLNAQGQTLSAATAVSESTTLQLPGHGVYVVAVAQGGKTIKTIKVIN